MLRNPNNPHDGLIVPKRAVARASRGVIPHHVPLAWKKETSREWNNESIIDAILTDPTVTVGGGIPRVDVLSIGSQGYLLYETAQILSDTEAHVIVRYSRGSQRCILRGGEFTDMVDGQDGEDLVRVVKMETYDAVVGTNRVPVLVVDPSIKKPETATYKKLIPHCRTWFSKDKKHQIVAAYYGVAGADVRLIDEDHKITNVPIESLSKEDQEHIRSLRTLKASAIRYVRKYKKKDITIGEYMRQSGENWIKNPHQYNAKANIKFGNN
jgi:hypothetical protein